VSVLTRQEKVALLRGRLADTEEHPRDDGLSPAQKRLWELENQLGASEMHVFALAYHLDGPLDSQQLAESIAAVAERHSALHSRVAVANGQPIFVSVMPPSLALRSFTCSASNGGDEKLEVLLRAEAATPIDVRTSAGWRAILFERSTESHTLLVQFHHIFADRWSVGVFMADVATAFRNIKAGRPPFDAKLPRGEPMSNDIDASQLAHWKNRFASPPATLKLPSARRIEVFSDYAGSRLASAIGADHLARLQQLATTQSTTLFPLLLAAFAATVHACTAQDDLVVCTPMVGRHRAGTRGVIGYFNNIVPLRLDLSRDPTFSELVARVDAEARDAATHQDVPFHTIASLPELASARMTRCLFAVQKMPGLMLELPGVKVRYRDVPNGTANFDLALFLEETDGKIEVLLDHKTAVLDTAAVTSLQERFFETLALVAAQPTLRLSELPQQPRAQHDPVTSPIGSVWPRDLLESRMVDIWRAMFPGADVNEDSHFFELGGDSLRAARLFALIEKEFGHQLPLAALIDASTPRQLIAKIRKTDWAAPWISLIAIKSTGTRPPLFCVHGGGGNVLAFKFIGDCLEADQPLYSLQARGLKRGEDPQTTVEEMAEHYVESVRQFFPRGPYLLAGHSLGAAVAIEMAQRFVAAGDRVAFVGLFDHPGPRLRISWTDWLRYQAAHVSRLPAGDRVGYLLRGFAIRTHLRGLSRRVSSSLKRISSQRQGKATVATKPPAAVKPAPTRSRPDLFENSLRAMLAYEVRPYPGRLTLFRARYGSPRIHADPFGGWEGVARDGLDLVEVPGSHTGMLEQPHVKALGKAVSECIERLDLTG
jgi:thioesterase domain-containing protein/acyl carrier protein